MERADAEKVPCDICGERRHPTRIKSHQKQSNACKLVAEQRDFYAAGKRIVDKQSPIYLWATFWIKDAIHTHDAEGNAWLPGWFCALWVSISKSPVTGRADCPRQTLDEGIRNARNSERRMKALEAQARILKLSFFNKYGDILDEDDNKVFSIRSPGEGAPPIDNTRPFTREDYLAASRTLQAKPTHPKA